MATSVAAALAVTLTTGCGAKQHHNSRCTSPFATERFDGDSSLPPGAPRSRWERAIRGVTDRPLPRGVIGFIMAYSYPGTSQYPPGAGKSAMLPAHTVEKHDGSFAWHLGPGELNVAVAVVGRIGAAVCHHAPNVTFSARDPHTGHYWQWDNLKEDSLTPPFQSTQPALPRIYGYIDAEPSSASPSDVSFLISSPSAIHSYPVILSQPAAPPARENLIFAA